MNPEAADLWSRAAKAMQTAKDLVAQDPDASASRAYYAAFYAVSALFVLKGSNFSRHSGIESAVHRDLVKAGEWVVERGKDYSFLLRLRMTGDYGGGVHVTEEDAIEALRCAQRVVEAVQKTSPEPLPQL